MCSPLWPPTKWDFHCPTGPPPPCLLVYASWLPRRDPSTPEAMHSDPHPGQVCARGCQAQQVTDSRSALLAPRATGAPSHPPPQTLSQPQGSPRARLVEFLASPEAAAQAEGFRLSRLDGRTLPPSQVLVPSKRPWQDPWSSLLPWDGWLPAACSPAWENS